MRQLCVLFALLVVACHPPNTDTENTPPTVTILSPLDGASLRAESGISLSAMVSDAETAPEDLVITWTSSLDGVLPGTTVVSGGVASLDLEAPLSPGDQVLTVVVTDSENSRGMDEADFTVVENKAPTVVFTSPASGDTFVAGSDVTVAATVMDDADAPAHLVLVWGDDAAPVSAPGTLTGDGTVSFVLPDIASGAWLLSLTVTDTEDASTRGEVAFTVEPAPDVDDDGFAAIDAGGTDCDDTDPAVHPGAAEDCDGVDDDCDGTVDDGVITDYYVDDDIDGYGRSGSTPTAACTAPEGYVSNSSDCNDSDAAVQPGAAETCNNVDDNCNGRADEGLDTSVYYVDGDSDGYGNDSTATVACAWPTDYVVDNTDCDDADPDVNPGMLELTNGIDDDCDGDTDETECVAYPVGTSPVGVLFDGTDIWVANENSNNVYQIDRDTGDTLKVWPTGHGAQYLTFDGSRIWVTNPGDATVTAMDPVSGASKAYSTGGNMPDGITFDGTHIWVTNYSSGTVIKMLASTGDIVKTISVGKSPRFLAFDGTDIWVSVAGADQVARIKATTGEVVATYAVSSYPYAVTFDGTNIWVTQGAANKVAKLDGKTGALLGTYDAGMLPNGMAFDGDDIWITDQVASTVPFPMDTVCTLTRLRASDGAPLGTYTVGERPQWVTSDGEYIWVTNGSDNTVSRCSF